MKAVILVGGEGTRLRPLTLAAPKPLMPVANRPFLEHQLAHLNSHGITEAILLTGYKAEEFDSVESSTTHGVSLEIVREEKLLDTCGAVRSVSHLLDETFVVCNGDVLTDLDITAQVAFHRERGAAGTLALTRVRDPSAYGLVPTEPDGRITQFIEKPDEDEASAFDLINAGTYVLEPGVLGGVPSGRYSFERDLFPLMVDSGEALYGWESPAYWLDLGTPMKYLRASFDVLDRRAGCAPPGAKSALGAWILSDAQIDDTARVRGPSVVGSKCRIDPQAVINPRTCLGAGCVVGPKATIEASVILAGVEVGGGASVEGCIIASGARIGEHCRLTDAVIGPGVIIGDHNELKSGVRLWPGVELPPSAISF